MPCSPGALRPTTGVDPDSERNAFQMRHRMGGDGDAVRETGDFHAHPQRPTFADRERASITASMAARSAGNVS